MKKVILYLIIIGFTLNGAYGMTIYQEFTFWWWLNIANVFIWGGYLIHKLMEYLKN